MGDSARSENFQFLKDGYLHVSVRKKCLSIALCLEEGSYSRIYIAEFLTIVGIYIKCFTRWI